MASKRPKVGICATCNQEGELPIPAQNAFEDWCGVCVCRYTVLLKGLQMEHSAKLQDIFRTMMSIRPSKKNKNRETTIPSRT